MSFSRWNVDYGPIALPVGSTREATADAPRKADLAADASRLQSMLTQTLFDQGNAQSERDPFITDSDDRTAPGETPSEPELGIEIERLWTSNGNGGLREVRLRLADTLIPDTWIKIHNAGGELQIELTARLEGTRQWLDRSSMQLAEDIGRRLQCPVRVSVYEQNGAEAGSAAFRWEGNQAS